MTFPDWRLVDTDPTAITLAWLKTHPKVLDAVGNSGASGEIEGPWPHIRVTPGGGVVGLLLDAVSGEVVIEVYGDPSGSSPSALKRIGMTCLLALRELVERDVAPGEATVSVAAAVSPLAPSPLTNRQGRWRVTVRLVCKPAN